MATKFTGAVFAVPFATSVQPSQSFPVSAIAATVNARQEVLLEVRRLCHAMRSRSGMM